MVIQGITVERAGTVKREAEQSAGQGYSEEFGHFNEEGIYKINSSSHMKLFIKFKKLYVNRMQHIGTIKRKSENNNQCTFKP